MAAPALRAAGTAADNAAAIASTSTAVMASTTGAGARVRGGECREGLEGLAAVYQQQ